MTAHASSLSTSLNAMRAAEIWLHERADASPSISELANYLGYSEAQIRRNFNRVFGISPGRYRDSLRLERAALLLCRTPMQVLDVAISCGYRSHAIFTRAFHGYFGVSPSDYRRRFHDRLRDSVPRRAPEALTVETQRETRCFLTRHYGDVPVSAHPSLWRYYAQRWQQYLAGCQTARTWVYHDDPNITPAGRVRIDFGFRVQGDCVTPPAMAFRQVHMPSRRQAKMRVTGRENIIGAFAYLLYEWLPTHNEWLSGEPVMVMWEEGASPHTPLERFELGVPLLAIH
ncbi:AraC family transcriptional regulator [Chromohalobacter marismortui]|uniref:AraC family transcriptional regulator n=1 Tax=Chromohalobacter marismortui TaxID=42055 RepID=A0A4R7NVA0_9GAMM|nr:MULTISPECIES: AraC family transcriptional regulator [Chromohalobacter]MCI0510321.1 AraC family transcriptional regulator [Chromohalobacter sp.]MCI0592721.1 AraC family transcriptional regulator [Chromohalobacter sp.]TDU25104.1 AraC family transcriptional regulator [Chromohalobacter marismortui]